MRPLAGGVEGWRLTFTVHGTPAPQGSKSAIVRDDGRKVILEGRTTSGRKAVRAWRTAVGQAALVARTKHGWRAPLPAETPVQMSVIFKLAPPKGVRRRWPTVRPDLDKLLRATFDALTGVLVSNDAQIVHMKELGKRYTEGLERPGCAITIAPWP